MKTKLIGSQQTTHVKMEGLIYSNLSFAQRESDKHSMNRIE